MEQDFENANYTLLSHILFLEKIDKLKEITNTENILDITCDKESVMLKLQLSNKEAGGI